MFAKNILSITALLFIGSQLLSVNAENACVFDSVSAGSCSVGSCSSGEQNKYYVITGGNTAVYTGTNISGVLVKVNGAGDDCDPVTDIGIFKTTLANGTPAYISKDSIGQISFLDDLATTPDCVDGKLTDTGNLCIDSAYSNAITLTAGKNYLVKNAYSIFTGTAADLVATKYEDNGNSLIKDESITGDEDYCVSSTTKVITERAKNYCDTTIGCDEYYVCTTGLCEDKTTDYSVRKGTCNPITGAECEGGDNGDYYYIGNAKGLVSGTLGESLETTAGTTGYLYKCTISGGSSSGCTIDESSAGYFVNSAGDDIKYIQCTVGESSNTCKGLIDAPETVVNCVANSSGIILDGAQYKQCTDENDVNATPITAKSNTIQVTDTCTSNGELIKGTDTNYKICVKQSNDSLVAVEFSTASYFIDSGNTSPFNDNELANHFVMVDIDSEKAVLNTTAKKYRYAITATRQIIEKANAEANGMCQSGSLKTTTGHEFAMTKPSAGVDHVNYYKDNTEI